MRGSDFQLPQALSNWPITYKFAPITLVYLTPYHPSLTAWCQYNKVGQRKKLYNFLLQLEVVQVAGVKHGVVIIFSGELGGRLNQWR